MIVKSAMKTWKMKNKGSIICKLFIFHKSILSFFHGHVIQKKKGSPWLLLTFLSTTLPPPPREPVVVCVVPVLPSSSLETVII